MKRRGPYIAAVSIIMTAVMCAWPVRLSALGGVIKVRKVVFRGLNYLSKYELIGSGVRTETDGIVIDVDSVKKALGVNRMIKNFAIKTVNGDIEITVEENIPAFILAARDGKKTLLLEVDRELNFISSGRVHAGDRPVIGIYSSEIKGGAVSGELRRFLALLLDVEKGNLPVFREISGIDFDGYRDMKVYLRGRRTLFILAPDRGSFFRLNRFVAYLDGTGRYPESMQILGNAGVMK
jgi:hypothetical protein